MRLGLATGFLLLVTTVHAQDLPRQPEARKTNDLMTSDAIAPLALEQSSPSTLIPNGMFSKATTQPLPDKPQPVAHEDQWFAGGGPVPQLSNDLVMVAEKNDGRLMWHIKKINSCIWCGAPMTWKQAAFDRHALPMWALRSALMVADIEITHHLPCFQAGRCGEENPLLGKSRAQGYTVASALTVVPWIITTYLRKGDKTYRIGGYRHWWIVPAIGDASSAVGIIANLARWNRR
jgi:hypothetical protein